MSEVESAAARRLRGQWRGGRSDFATAFRYSEVTGIGEEPGVTRRDPSTVLRIGERYYVWYTRRKTAARKRQMLPGEQSWNIPAFDWDLAEIWFATSCDGFHWEEQGVAARRGPRDAHDGRSIFTPDVLYAEGRYWLYYQAVGHPYGIRTRNTVCMSWADSPDGPWQRWPQPVLEPGEPGEWLGDADDNEVQRYGAWDSHKVHDPFILRREGRYWLYYKGQPMGWGTRHDRGIGLGVAIADRPQGPFLKSPLNPVTNSGHETCLFPWGAGVAAICGHDGPEKDSVQYAPDGLNFEVMAYAVLPPPAPGPFAPDSYNDTRDGQGISWGLAHIATEETKGENSWIIRFDCDLRRGRRRPGFQPTHQALPASAWHSPDLAVNEANSRPRRWHPQTPAPPPHPPPERRSAATRRVYARYGVGKDQMSEYFSAFRYALVPGLEPEPGVSRRDPSKIIHVDGLYHVWYTRRATENDGSGSAEADGRIPACDQELTQIWHATSVDGLHWRERGAALLPGPAGNFDPRSVFAPDVLLHGGSYWLYYQTLQGRWTPDATMTISVARAQSPQGPWQRLEAPVLQPGAPGEWDAGRLHDPCVLFWRGQVWLFYRGERGGAGGSGGWGVALADDPRGPYSRSPLNPVTNSGRAPFLYPWRAGLVAITGQAGPEANCVQFAQDGLNFEIMGRVSAPPVSAGPYLTEAFSDPGTPYVAGDVAGDVPGNGVGTGLAHCAQGDDGPLQHSYLLRFECNLRRGEDRQDFYRSWNYRFPPSVYFSQDFRLTPEQRAAAIELMRASDVETSGPA